MTDLYTKTVTIYNSIPAANDSGRRFDRHTIRKCLVHGGVFNLANGTIDNEKNGQSVIIKDVSRYQSPIEYAKAHPSVCESDDCYTINVGDFVVFYSVPDTVGSAKEWLELKAKYKNCGMTIESVMVNIHGMDVDNITVSNG